MLVKAKYPLSFDYQLPVGGDGESAITTSSGRATVEPFDVSSAGSAERASIRKASAVSPLQRPANRADPSAVTLGSTLVDGGGSNLSLNGSASSLSLGSITSSPPTSPSSPRTPATPWRSSQSSQAVSHVTTEYGTPSYDVDRRPSIVTIRAVPTQVAPPQLPPISTSPPEDPSSYFPVTSPQYDRALFPSRPAPSPPPTRDLPPTPSLSEQQKRLWLQAQQLRAQYLDTQRELQQSQGASSMPAIRATPGEPFAQVTPPRPTQAYCDSPEQQSYAGPPHPSSTRAQHQVSTSPRRMPSHSPRLQPTPQRSPVDTARSTQLSTPMTIADAGPEADVRRMLEARIRALQNALTTLDVDSSMPIPDPSSPSVAITPRGVLSAGHSSPPPSIPLPPLPSMSRSPTYKSTYIEESDVDPSGIDDLFAIDANRAASRGNVTQAQIHRARMGARPEVPAASGQATSTVNPERVWSPPPPMYEVQDRRSGEYGQAM